MATSSLGTNANNSIPFALKFTGAMADADVASLASRILNDGNRSLVVPGSFSKSGLLFIPNRGYLQVQPGDWVGVDSRGWPILLSADTIASGLWTHNP